MGIFRGQPPDVQWSRRGRRTAQAYVSVLREHLQAQREALLFSLDISKCQGALNTKADRKSVDYIRLHSLLGAIDSYRSIRCKNKY
jgi:hypothetical protein